MSQPGTLRPRGRVAVVGAGAFGRFCVQAYGEVDDLQVVAVADPDPSALAQVHAPDARLETDWRAVLSDEDVEVVHVATPPHLRGTLIEPACAAGKSVFCEKPLALSLAEADRLIAAAEHHGVALGVDYVMRHQPAYRFLETLAASGDIGRLRTISFQNLAQQVPSGHWFWDRGRSGGILVEHGVHFFDVYARIAGSALAVVGSEPRAGAIDVRVTYAAGALGRYYHEFGFPREVECTVAVLGFERGCVMIEGWIPARLTGSILAPPRASLETAAALHIDLIVSAEQVDGEPVTRFEATFPDRDECYRAGIVAGMRDVVHRHRNPGHRMAVSPEDARTSLALALAAQAAAHTGRAVPLDHSAPN